MLSRAFFHHEKCMQSIFRVLRWTKHLTQDVPTKLVTHWKDQFTPQTSPTLGNKRYVNAHSHLEFLM
ncbi:unnamed protein product, partial [Staurois parvus]